jgi:serine/threonine-protein kinase
LNFLAPVGFMKTTPTDAIYEFGPFRLDTHRRRLMKDAVPVMLRPKLFDLLLALAERAGQDVDKDELIRIVWPDAVVEDNNLPHAISKLRKALGERRHDHRYVVTVPGRGYRFVAPVLAVGAARDAGRSLPRVPRGAADSQVHVTYVKGRHHWNRRTPESLGRAIGCFNAAIARDPAFGPAYAALADCYVLGGGGSLSRRETMSRARAAAMRALALDENLPDAHASLAAIAFRWDWNWTEAERAFRRAVELDPGNAAIRHGYAVFLAAMGRFDEAVAQMRSACVIDPVSLVAAVGLGRVLDFARRHTEAIEHYREALEIDRGFAEAYFDLAMAYEHVGALDDAQTAARRAMALAPDSVVYAEYVAYFHALDGDRAYVEAFLRGLIDRAERQYVSPFLHAHLLLGLGELDECLEWLELACEQRAGEIVYLQVDPDVDRLRSHARFQTLLRRVGFANPLRLA